MNKIEKQNRDLAGLVGGYQQPYKPLKHCAYCSKVSYVKYYNHNLCKEHYIDMRDLVESWQEIMRKGDKVNKLEKKVNLNKYVRF
jgi:hypothetical protein